MHMHSSHHEEDLTKVEYAHTRHTHKSGGLGVSIRAATGLSGDILLTGMTKLCGLSATELDEIVDSLKLPSLKGCVKIAPRLLNGISGWGAEINLPEEHSHRRLGEILSIIKQSELTEKAKASAEKTFRLLATAEAKVHSSNQEDVTFHEVGALDSILDICVVCALFARLSPLRLVVSPLPLCDGVIKCAHGLLPSPAPATLELLNGVAVRGLASTGETVTPTAIALLKALGAEFGAWPVMCIEERALVYGGRYFPGVPNGVIFACGELLS